MGFIQRITVRQSSLAEKPGSQCDGDEYRDDRDRAQTKCEVSPGHHIGESIGDENRDDNDSHGSDGGLNASRADADDGGLAALDILGPLGGGIEKNGFLPDVSVRTVELLHEAIGDGKLIADVALMDD